MFPLLLAVRHCIRQGGLRITKSSRTTMNIASAQKKLPAAIICALALGLAAAPVQAQTFPPAADRELVKDTSKQVWMNGFGECWHSAFGPPPPASAQCDPNYRPVTQAAPAPAPYVAPPSAPAVVAVAAPQTVYEKVSFDADALFDFDKAELRPAGRSALDEFAGKLRDISPTTISVAGHTDRLGTERYNQNLSEQRASAVRSYLMSRGVAPEIMQAEGKGETQPVTKLEDCKGGKSARLIACLQPDRRVEVEVSGTRIAR